jgi:hypothetical protein
MSVCLGFDFKIGKLNRLARPPCGVRASARAIFPSLGPCGALLIFTFGLFVSELDYCQSGVLLSLVDD